MFILLLCPISLSFTDRPPPTNLNSTGPFRKESTTVTSLLFWTPRLRLEMSVSLVQFRRFSFVKPSALRWD